MSRRKIITTTDNRIIGTGNFTPAQIALTTGSAMLSFAGLAHIINQILEERGIVVPAEEIEAQIQAEIEAQIRRQHTDANLSPTATNSSTSSRTPSVDIESLVDYFDEFGDVTDSNSSSHGSSYYDVSSLSDSTGASGDGLKRRNNWVSHVKNYAQKHNISYFQALKDPKCKSSYRK